VFYSERNTLSPSQRDAILSEVAGIREMLRELRDDLALEGRVRGGANIIWGKCAVLSVNLEELKDKHLVRYGEPVRGEVRCYQKFWAYIFLNGIGPIHRSLCRSVAHYKSLVTDIVNRSF